MLPVLIGNYYCISNFFFKLGSSGAILGSIYQDVSLTGSSCVKLTPITLIHQITILIITYKIIVDSTRKILLKCYISILIWWAKGTLSFGTTCKIVFKIQYYIINGYYTVLKNLGDFYPTSKSSIIQLTIWHLPTTNSTNHQRLQSRLLLLLTVNSFEFQVL